MPGMSTDILIVGAGAAGLTAALFAARAVREAGADAKVLALDGATKLGAKVLVSGGGRCNVTHDVVTPEDYAGASRNAVAKVLRTFTVEQTVAHFVELGVTLKREETGKLFPTTDAARTVLEALVRGALDAGAEVRNGHRVTGIEIVSLSQESETIGSDRLPDANARKNPQLPLASAPMIGSLSQESDPIAGTTGRRFRVRVSGGEGEAEREFFAGAVILATGGKSLPKTGSDGAGYGFAQALGHTITPPVPALVPLVLPEKHPLTTLSGIAMDVTLTLAAGSGKALHRQAGAMLFTHFGISGPAAMDISGHWIRAKETDSQATLLCDFTNGATFAAMDDQLQRAARDRPKATVNAVLADDLPHRVAATICELVDVDPRGPINKLERDARRTLVHALIALPLPIVRDRGYLFAEVTAGGVPLSEVDLGTMQSRKCPGLYLCGEILDVDGRIGGYNYQWAWCSARLAGLAAGKAAGAVSGD